MACPLGSSSGHNEAAPRAPSRGAARRPPRSSRTPLLIYGSTGFTGRLVARRARDAGLHPVLAGRDAERLRGQAAALGLAWRAVALDARARLAAALSDIAVVINAAGPFAETARPLVEACLDAGCHYLDVSGELPTFEAAWQQGRRAAERGVMLMPGVGWAVVASDCAAARAAALVPQAAYLRLALSTSTAFSRGSLVSALGLISSRVAIRRNGRLIAIPAGRLEREFDFGTGPRRTAAISWPDVCTAYLTTGVPNIEVYAQTDAWIHAAVQIGAPFAEILSLPLSQSWLHLCAGLLPEGPTDAARRLVRHVLVVEAEDGWRRRRQVRVETVDGYAFTAAAATEIAGRVLRGEFRPGFQTPARVYGPDLLASVGGAHVQSSGAAFEDRRPGLPSRTVKSAKGGKSGRPGMLRAGAARAAGGGR
jgi:short subunit dehydrogenase-like uncharacterized protein